MQISLQNHVRLMAQYNHWMNEKILAACEQLTPAQLAENRGAFFGSILGTLNHLLVGDTVWLKRFAAVLADYSELAPVKELPFPEALNATLFSTLDELKVRRALLDQVLLAFSGAVTEQDLRQPVAYKSFKGVASTKSLFNLLMHVFNHQTHHRGQLTTLLSQCGIDAGVTDLVAIIPDA